MLYNCDLIYANIQSLFSNKDQLVHDLIPYNPRAILLSEARTTTDMNNSELQLDGYQLARCDSSNRHTGGVILYIRNDCNFKIIKKIQKDGVYWFMLIKIKIGNETCLLGCLYRSPSSSFNDFFDEFEEWAEQYFNESCKCIIVGDFNTDYLKGTDRYVNRFKSFISMIGVDQLINEPTRITKDSKTLVDFVLSNRQNTISSVHHTPKITDHSIICVSLCNRNVSNEKIVKHYRKFNEQILEKLNDNLLNWNWNLDTVDINTISLEILSTLECEVNKVAPLKTYSIANNMLPWYDYEVKELAKQRDNHYKHFKLCSNDLEMREVHWECYRSARNQVVNLLKSKKSEYFQKKVNDNINNPKKMWQTLKKIINTEIKSMPPEIIFDVGNRSISVSDDIQKAEMFNSFFIDSIQVIQSSITQRTTWTCEELPPIETNFSEFKLLTISDVRVIVNSLDNKCNSYFANESVLKSTFQVMGHVILNFINTSLRTGQFPSSLKVSTVVPIAKIENNNEAKNFRPINTLPPLEKILELSVYHQFSHYLEHNNLIMEYQSAFRAKHSCETALQVTLTKWKFDMDRNKYIVAVFLDFKRAFETIDITVLLKKLKYYGVSNAALLWFKNFLTTRSQNTKVNNVKSSNKNVTSGVPQGSVLGPLLFILYLNDIKYVEGCEELSLFADDSMIAASDEILEKAVQKINKALSNLANFLDTNCLKLNVAKTKGMIITTEHKHRQIDTRLINLEMYGEQIEIVSEVKYLGFQLDHTLSMKKHFNYISSKISKKVYFFSRLRRNVTFNTAILVYKSIIQPHLDYCSSLLMLLDGNSIASLQKLQNRGMRLLLECNRYTPIKLMLDTLNWLSVEDRIFYSAMIFIFKITHSLSPPYFNQFIKYNNEIHTYPTRNNTHFYVPRANYARTQKSLFHNGLLEFNKLPSELKDSDTLVTFKSELFRYLRCR